MIINKINKDIVNYWNKVTQTLQEKNREKFFNSNKKKSSTNN